MAFLREIKRERKSGKVYTYWVVIKTFWDKKKRKVRHKVLHDLGHPTVPLLQPVTSKFAPGMRKQFFPNFLR